MVDEQFDYEQFKTINNTILELEITGFFSGSFEIKQSPWEVSLSLNFKFGTNPVLILFRLEDQPPLIWRDQPPLI